MRRPDFTSSSGVGAVSAAWRRLPSWLPLIVLLMMAASLRLSTLSLQSLWYDEAYTPVHVLHAGLGATLHSWLADENTPPLWYVLVWAVSRIAGIGVLALRMPSALAGIALVGVGWLIGAELGTRRTALTLAAILAFNPLFVWYSQEARAYELYTLFAAISLLWFLRARRSHSGLALAGWSASSILALLSHYFAFFLIAPEALLLLAAVDWPRAGARFSRAQRPTLIAVAVVAAAGAGLVPLVIAQGGHGTQWIGQWALSNRVVQIAGYYLLGYNGSVLGHTLLGVSALPVIGAIVLAVMVLRRGRLEIPARRAVAVTAGLGAVAILLPLALALAGADYLAPRNLIADYVPLSAALAVVLSASAARRAGMLLTLVICAAGLSVVIATDLYPRLQRGDWGALAHQLAAGSSNRAIVTVEDGAAPLEYYLPGMRLRYLSSRSAVSVTEIDLVGYDPLRSRVGAAPMPAFAAAGRVDEHGLLAFRFRAATPQRLSGRFLRGLTVTIGARARSEVLVPAAVPAVPSS